MFELKCRSCGKTFKPGFKLVIVNSEINCPHCNEKTEPEKDPSIKKASYILTAAALILMFALSGAISDMGQVFAVWAVIIVIYTIIKMWLVCRLYNKADKNGKI